MNSFKFGGEPARLNQKNRYWILWLTVAII
jgi:hypothetical protein